MNLKLFYSPPWKAFEVPEKPEFKKGKITQHKYRQVMKAFYKTYDEAKANALEVGNAEVIKPVFWEMQSGAEYTWYGSAVIKDGKYILSI